jgi:hypothetical protein
MKRIFPPVVATLLCVLLAVAFFQWWRISALQRELEAGKSSAAVVAPVAHSPTPEPAAAPAKEAATPVDGRAAEVEQDSNALRQKLARVAPNAVLPPGMASLPTPMPLPAFRAVHVPDEPPKAQNDLTKALGKLFTDPKMKDAMFQKELAASRMMYADLPQELKLSPSEADQLISLLAERQTESTRKTMSMLDPASGGASLEEIGKASEDLKAEYDRRLKAVLGDGRLDQLQAYEKTVADRMMLRQFQQSSAAVGKPLDDTQRRALLKIIVDARSSVPLRDATGAPPKGSMTSEEGMRAFLAQQDEVNRRVLLQAQAVLNQEQLVAFRKMLDEWVQTQRAGMQMSRTLFQGSSG